MAAGEPTGASRTVVERDARAAFAAIEAGAPVTVSATRCTQVLGSESRDLSEPPAIVEVAPVEDQATAVRTAPDARRSLRSMRTTSLSLKAAATCAWVRTRGIHDDHGTDGSRLQWSSTEVAYGSAPPQTSAEDWVAPPDAAK